MAMYCAHWLLHFLAAHPVERTYLFDLVRFYTAKVTG
jgi:hypothetical protein